MSNSANELPLFPLGTVLFPGNILPLRIFEPRYVDLIGRCMRDASGFGIVAIQQGRETGVAAIPHDVGTVAHIKDFDQGSDGLLSIVVEGAQRFRIRELTTQADQLLMATVDYLSATEVVPLTDDYEQLSALLENIVNNVDAKLLPTPLPRDAAGLGYLLGQFLPVPMELKLAWLSEEEPLRLLDEISNTILQFKQAQKSD